MKRKMLAVVCVTLLVLAGCATLPDPKNPEDVLVLGRLVLSYPDGMLGGPAQDANHGVKVVLRDEVTGRSQMAYTGDGFYRFVVPAGGRFILESYEYEIELANWRRTVGPYPLGIDFVPGRSTVVFLASITYVFRAPGVVADSEYGGTHQRTFSYEVAIEVDADPAIAEDYITARDPDSPWLDYPIIIPDKLRR